jgi:hypothetical protein
MLKKLLLPLSVVVNIAAVVFIMSTQLPRYLVFVSIFIFTYASLRLWLIIDLTERGKWNTKERGSFEPSFMGGPRLNVIALYFKRRNDIRAPLKPSPRQATKH